VGYTSAERKFVRGVKQAAAICREVKDFESGNAYGLSVERASPHPDRIEYTCFAVERTRPPDDWSLALGDAVHNLRASLDHAVWAASDPALRDNRTIFPITDSAKSFGDAEDRIAGVPDNVRSLIAEAQPFRTDPNDPRFAPLAFLRKLSNADKHRELTTVAVQVEMPVIGYQGPRSDVSFTDKGQERDLSHGAKVMAFAVTGPKAAEVTVEPVFGYEVRVEGFALRGSLERIAWFVWKSVSECETGQRFPLMTPPLFVLLPDRTEFPADPFFLVPVEW
jgi:hypothetical protein